MPRLGTLKIGWSQRQVGTRDDHEVTSTPRPPSQLCASLFKRGVGGRQHPQTMGCQLLKKDESDLPGASDTLFSFIQDSSHWFPPRKPC